MPRPGLQWVCGSAVLGSVLIPIAPGTNEGHAVHEVWVVTWGHLADLRGLCSHPGP